MKNTIGCPACGAAVLSGTLNVGGLAFGVHPKGVPYLLKTDI